MPDSHSSRRGRGGQVLVMVTVALVPMIAMVGLVTDAGYLYYIKNSAQAAADSAALSAVYRFNRTIAGSSFACDSYDWICRTDPTPCASGLTTAANPPETACLYAKQNGFDTANSNQSVTIQSNVTPTPPTAPGVAGAAYWITVRVSQRVPLLFSAVMGNTSGLVAARATGATYPATGCVYTLDPVAPQSFYQNGSTSFRAACGINVNSSNSAALVGNGGATLETSAVNVVGGYNWQGTISPTPNTGVNPFPEPLSGLQAPAPCSASGGCNDANCAAHPSQVVVNSNTTLSPGTYCGGIFVKKGLATFSSGTYILVGGGISTQDSNSRIAGSGVYFYNTYNSTNTYTPINLKATSSIQLAAATSGAYAGILYMQDRACCSATMPTESFQGGATSSFEGIVYAPRSLVEFAGNASLGLAHYTIIIARRYTVKGSSTINNDFSHLVGGNPIKQVGLVE